MDYRFIDAGGLKTAYLDVGEGDPVVLIHGGGAGADSLGNWSGCIPTLAKSFRVIAMDMVGFGKTDKPNPASFAYTQSARVKHLIDFIEAMGLSKASLVGNSMGGATALGACMDRPDLVRKLVLMGSAGLTTHINESVRVILGFSPSLENMRKMVGVLTGKDFRLDPAMLDYRLSIAEGPGTMAAYGATMKWVGEQGGLFYPEERIKEVKHEVLLVNGKDDQVVPPETAWKFSTLLENSRLYLIPRCGHWAMIEHPEEFTQVTAWFLSRPS